ncbi:MAG: NAD(P)/FAD-dependent oxidoreductase, partial [Pseudomonadota bacterium]
TGLAVLSLLELDREIIEGGSIIRQLYGKVAGSKSVTLDVKYKDFASHLFVVGTHRGNLFSALYNKVLQIGVEIKSSNEIVEVAQINGKVYLIDINGQKFGDYDLLIDASGQKSCLRAKYANIKLDKPYPYGAVWSLVKIQDDKFRLDTLGQRYKNAYHMIGVLPVGKLNSDTCTSAAFFWSMRVADYQKWREQEFSKWQEYVAGLWSETEPLLKQFNKHDDLTLATYRDVILNKYHSGNIVFIGDAAHCTSPQLGQGANLALVDALVLSKCIDNAESISEALEEYNNQRNKHLGFYQMASRMLTPFFQSDSLFFAKLRFFTCGLACKIPFTRKIAAHVLTGTKTGLVSTLNPGDWSKNYDLFNKSSNALIE